MDAEPRFFPEANYTPTPNLVFDEIMRETTSLAELKVTLALTREIYGRAGGKRVSRLISLAQLQELTGLSRQSCQQGAMAAIARGFFARVKGPNGAFVYGARVKDLSVQESRPPVEPGVQESRPPVSIGTKERKKVSSTPKKSGGADFIPAGENPVDAVVVELFELWRKQTDQPANTRLTNRRAGEALARLREQAKGCPRETALADARGAMREAVEGWIASEWHRERMAYDWKTLFRSYDKVEYFRGKYREQQAARVESSTDSVYATTKANPELEGTT